MLVTDTINCDQGFGQRIQIQTNNIVESLDKVHVATELERLDQMRLEAMLVVYPTDGGFAQSSSFRHAGGRIGCLALLPAMPLAQSAPSLQALPSSLTEACDPSLARSWPKLWNCSFCSMHLFS